MRLLLVEDDAMIGRAVAQALRGEGYAVDWTQDGISAETAATGTPYDLLLLDLGLPGRDGMEVLRRIRAAGRDLPVLILTARDAVEQRVAGLDSGADDYLPKPFDLDELSARVRALLRRSHPHRGPVLEHAGVTLDPATHKVLLEGREVTLTSREFEVLRALLENPSRVLSRDALRGKLYGWHDEVDSNTVEVYVHSLRRKLGPRLITTVRGLGYALGPAP
ncbi:MAG TPA: response regulator transcription factor [Nevskiaceae bacterium]